MKLQMWSSEVAKGHQASLQLCPSSPVFSFICLDGIAVALQRSSPHRLPCSPESWDKKSTEKGTRMFYEAPAQARQSPNMGKGGGHRIPPEAIDGS